MKLRCYGLNPQPCKLYLDPEPYVDLITSRNPYASCSPPAEKDTKLFLQLVLDLAKEILIVLSGLGFRVSKE